MTTVRDIQELFGRYELHVKKVIKRNDDFLNNYRKLSENLESKKVKADNIKHIIKQYLTIIKDF